MDISGSRCSSGCESGWTLYFDQSSLSENQYQGFGGVVDEGYGGKGARVEYEEEEDLSMVSDASSGPRYRFEDDESCFIVSASRSQKKRKSKERGGSRNQMHSCCLDDTASSPAGDFSKKNSNLSKNEGLEFSQGFSATHVKGKSAFNKRFGFFKSSLDENSASKQIAGFQGRKWE